MVRGQNQNGIKTSFYSIHTIPYGMGIKSKWNHFYIGIYMWIQEGDTDRYDHTHLSDAWTKQKGYGLKWSHPLRSHLFGGFPLWYVTSGASVNGGALRFLETDIYSMLGQQASGEERRIRKLRVTGAQYCQPRLVVTFWVEGYRMRVVPATLGDLRDFSSPGALTLRVHRAHCARRPSFALARPTPTTWPITFLHPSRRILI